ncbi:MAG: hypothetical protein AVDCRST_MAG93-1544, partial [uncultured Chloroflexia bacterium]
EPGSTVRKGAVTAMFSSQHLNPSTACSVGAEARILMVTVSQL